MPSLFIVMLGGRHAKANTEVHDVVLAVGNTLDEVYPQLKNEWFGEAKGLHIDAWAQMNGVQSEDKHYQIHFTDQQPQPSADKLFLINLGGYDADAFGELHRYILVVAQNASAAKEKGKQHFAQGWYKPHTDRVLDVDDCIAIDQVYGHYIELIEGEYAETIWENTYLQI